jgi:hypothetical protein
MGTPNTNPLSYNGYIQTIAGMAVYTAAETTGVWAFIDAPPQLQVPQMLNYSELRIARDLDLLASQSSNTYTLTALSNVFSIPVDDFLTVQTVETVISNAGQVVNATPLLPVSKEFIQNVYGGLSAAGTPQYFAMYGSTFGDPGQDVNTNILLGPAPNFAYTIRVTGTARMPSLFKYAVAGVADTQFTYLSAYYPDLLVMASMIYISAFQRQFSATSDDVQMGQTYEKQYQALRLGAIAEENRRKAMGSGWTPYSTPVSATPTR